MKRCTYLVSLLFWGGFLLGIAPVPVYQGWFETTERGSELLVIALASTEQDTVLNYRLIATKKGASGRATTSQAGQVSLRGEQPAELAKLKLSLKPGENCQVTLKLFKGQHQVLERVLQAGDI